MEKDCSKEINACDSVEEDDERKREAGRGRGSDKEINGKQQGL